MKKATLLLASLFLFMASCQKKDDSAPANNPAPTDPVAFSLETIKLTGYNPMNSGGSYWDGGSGSNLPDCYVEVRKNGVLVFTSNHTASNVNSTTNLSSATSGSLPISFNETDDIEIKLYDDDGDPSTNAPDYMGNLVIYNLFPFVYGGDHAAGITDIEFQGSNDTSFKLSGSFVY